MSSTIDDIFCAGKFPEVRLADLTPDLTPDPEVDTASNQIDAQVEARWERLTQALSKDVAWLDK